MNYQSFFSRAASGMQESAIRKMGMLGSRGSDLISFAPGYPDPASFPWNEFAAIASEGFTARDAASLQYGPTHGFAPALITSRMPIRKPRSSRCATARQRR